MNGDRKRPAWDESKPGPTLATLVNGKQGPAFGPPTDEELEHARKELAKTRRLANSLGSAQLSRESQWVADAEIREEHHRLNLDHFLDAKPKAVGGAVRKREQIRIHRYALVCALRDIGRFQEALSLACTEKGVARPGFKQIADQVFEWGLAVARDDDEACNCKRRTHTVEARGKKIEIEIPRRRPVGPLFSFKHGKVVTLWRCSVCGFLNAHDLGHPENQQHLHALRAAVASGRMDPNNPQLMDHVVLKKERAT